MKKRIPHYIRLFTLIANLVLLIFFFRLCLKTEYLSCEPDQAHKQQEEYAAKPAEQEIQKEEAQALPLQAIQTKSTQPAKNSKIAYLTFDDGPSKYTQGLLDILKTNQVRATFFVVGTNAVQYPDILKAEQENGHTVGIHCYNHDYSVIYASQTAFLEDYNNMRGLLKDRLGVDANLCRLPGGTGNTISSRYGGKHFMKNIMPQVAAMGLTPFDWNVSSGDAAAASVPSEAVINNVINGAQKYNHPVILLHDTKKNTVEAVPTIIQQLKELGYSFESLSPGAVSCQQNPI